MYYKIKYILATFIIYFTGYFIGCNTKPPFDEKSIEYWTWKLHHITEEEGNDNPMIRYEIVEKLLKIGAIVPNKTSQEEVIKIFGKPESDFSYAWYYEINKDLQLTLQFEKGHSSRLESWSSNKIDRKGDTGIELLIKAGLPCDKLKVGMTQAEIRKILGAPKILWSWLYSLSPVSSIIIGFDENGIVTSYDISWDSR